ncbi:MAG TPA: helix-turn-helix domain-containing protein [Gaiellaceae bacterium]
MFAIGGSLAAARKGQGLTPSDVERLTCLRGRYIAALEDDDFTALPGRTYARAFVRTYSATLGLDANSFVDEFDAQWPEPVEEEAPAPMIRAPRPRLGRRIVALALVAAATVGIVAWVTTAKQNTLPSLTPPPAAHALPPPARSHVLAASHTSAPRASPLVISATNGTCWLLVRRGGASGAILFQGILAQGKTVRFTQHVWVRFGAPWNVQVHRGTKVPAGLAVTSPVNLSL